MTDELKQLIEDAAKLCGYELIPNSDGDVLIKIRRGACREFNPLDPDRGDLMKVAEAADLVIGCGRVISALEVIDYPRGDHASLALAILRAASAVLKARGGV